MLWIGPHSNLKADRSQKLDPKQKRHPTAPIDSGAVGTDQLKKDKERKEKKKKSYKHQTENQLLELQDNTVLSCIPGSQVSSAESTAQQCFAAPLEGWYSQGMAGTEDTKPAGKRGFAHSLLRTRIFIYPSKTHLLLTEVCQVFH